MNGNYLRLCLVIFFLSVKCTITVNAFHDRSSFNKFRDNYTTLWKKVDSLQKISLPKSALIVVNQIYQKAKSENNSPQYIKAIIFKIKFSSVLEEDNIPQQLKVLENEIKNSEFPQKQMLHSLLAQMYYNYYELNQYKFYTRTETTINASEDIETWDSKKIIQEINWNYNTSLSESEKLKKLPIKIYEPIIDQAKGREGIDATLRPTLYDFLAHRALDYYMNMEPDSRSRAYKFQLNDPHYFDSSMEFARMKIRSEDSLSMKFHALNILQDLLRFHLTDQTPEALIDVDLKRLNFVHENMMLSNKDSLYIKALERIENTYSTFSSSADASYEKASFFEGNKDRYNPLISEENKWERKKAYEICDSTISKFPNSYGGQKCKYLKSTILAKDIRLTVDEINSPDMPILALLKYQNIKRVYFKIIKITNSERIQYREHKSFDTLIKNSINKPLITWDIDLPDDGDFQSHAVEFKIPPLHKGIYVLVGGTDQKFSSKKGPLFYSFMTISNISYLQKQMNGKTEFFIADRETGFPIQNVNAQLWSRDYDYSLKKSILKKEETYRTNAEDFFEIPIVKNSRSFYIDFIYGKDTLYGSQIFGAHAYPDHDYKTTNISLFTDRAIYRPGQTIFYKGIVLNTTGKKIEIKANYSTTISFYDVNSQLISEQKVVSNEYGTFSGSFTAPMGQLNGSMKIQTEYGQTFVSVEEYKRPKFEGVFLPLTGTYKLGETIVMNGQAKAYAGSAIDHAIVKYRVVRNVHYPYWWYSRDYSSSNEMEITHGTTQTNELGGFNISFEAMSDPLVSKDSKPIYTYTIYADVIDISGETHSIEKSINVSDVALVISTDMPAQIEKKVLKVTINSSNLNGDFENSKGEIIISKLRPPDRILRTRTWERPDKHLMSKEEFYKNFPHSLYEDELNISKWDKEKKLFQQEYNTEENKQFKIEKFSGWEAGKYVLEINTKDKFGGDVKYIKYFSVLDLGQRDVKINGLDWLVTLNDVAEPGESAKFLLNTAEDLYVIYEIEHADKILSKSIIKLNKEQKIIEVPVEEKYRGGFAVHFSFIRNNRVYSTNQFVKVPWTNKELSIQFETFRDKLIPGQKEEWKVIIKDKKGDKVAAEMLASMYDASLNAFTEHDWSFNIFPTYRQTIFWDNRGSFDRAGVYIPNYPWNKYESSAYRSYPSLNLFGYNYYYYNRNIRIAAYGTTSSRVVADKAGDIQVVESKKADNDSGSNLTENENLQQSVLKTNPQNTGEKIIQIRKNLNETAFFYPNLQTNEKGEIIISFTIPEALTRWKMMGFAHTKDLKYGLIEKEVVTQKELMVIPNMPRFFREGDQVYLSSKITNLSDRELAGTVDLLLFDALTMLPVNALFKNNNERKNFTAKKDQSSAVEWRLNIPQGIEAVTYRIVARAENFSDGEEAVIPVLTNRMLVTESLPLPIGGNQTKNFTFNKLINNSSTTLKNHKLTLEFTSNPAWYAIQALPYLMEYPYECAEQIFSRFYANSIATDIANSSPKIKAVFDSWKNNPDSKALLSNLEKNQELKSVLLEETPWVLDAKSEAERKKRVALLFDLNKMSGELQTALEQLKKMQLSNGAWPWFEGMPEDRFITQHIATGLGHLDHLGIKNIRSDNNTWYMLKAAIRYLDAKIYQDYDYLVKNKIKLEGDNISSIQIQYLYARSYFKDLKVENKNLNAFNYYKGQAMKYWMRQNKYLQGMIALSLTRFEDNKTPLAIVKSLREHALHSEELGMYWMAEPAFYWYQAPVETQALLIEVFDEVAKDKTAVDNMKVWLLKQKQTQNWSNTKATTEACYALLLRRTDWLSDNSLAEITVGGQKIEPEKIEDIKVEAGPGYFKTSWTGENIKSEMGNVTVTKKSEGIAWGALYWQYFEQLDKITSAETPINLKKQLFLQENSPTGPILKPISEETKLNPGDLLKVRIELRVDRSMEYVHMKDMRAAGFEPVNVLSGYKYQGGLGYYESTRDAATNFFFSYLNKGTYVFEYPLRVNQKGNFSNGITSIQCMYAPEFSSHSEGIRVNVGQENFPPQVFTDEGIVKKGIPVEVDGCGTMIEIGGVSYKALHLPKEYIVDKLKVKVTYKPGEIFYCGRGRAPIKTVEILKVEKR